MNHSGYRSSAAATSLAVEDPAHAHAAAPLLGHHGLTMTERHYNVAGSLEAGRRHAAALGRLRRDTVTAARPRRRRRPA